MHCKHGNKRNSLALALLAALGGSLAAPQAMAANGEFCMFDPLGDVVNGGWATDCDQAVAATITAIGTAGSSLASPSLFYGQNWTAHSISTYETGSYTIDTGNGDYNFSVGAGQIGVHMLFNWGPNADIDVVNVWDVSSSGGVQTYTSTDWDGDGILGGKMIDGPFQGFSANFNLSGADLPAAPPPPDNTPPVISGTENASISQGGTWTETATCTDGVDGNIPVGSGFTISGDVNTGTPGSYTINYSCTDSSGNNATSSRTVTVTAAGEPVITLLGDNPLSLETSNTAYDDPGATCTDVPDGNIVLGANFSIIENTVAPNVPGSYSVTYRCTDSNDNSTETTRTVEITASTTAPTITLDPTCPIVAMAGDPDPTPTATAKDVLDNDLQVTQTGSVDTNPIFSDNELAKIFDLSFSATDANDNNATASCQVTIGNPTPVVTLEGPSSAAVSEGEGYADPGASCLDFNPDAPGTPDSLEVNADFVIDTTTPAGSYTITYSCTDGDTNVGTATRSVLVGGDDGYTADSDTSGSNFTMLDPTGNYVGGADDIFSNWDGSLLASMAENTINMTMGSALPTPFFGFPWQSHSIRVFGPGSYELTTSRGNPLSFTVGPNQVGAHMLFDWNNNNDIDVAIVWNINGSFSGNGPVSGQVFNLVSVDGDGDGFPGIRMPDGPFEGFSANFNINFTPAYVLGAVEAPVLTVDQGGTTRSVLTGGGNVTVSASTGGSFDWSGSSEALVARAVGDTSSATFSFDPSTLSPGSYTLAVAIDEGAASGSLAIRVLTESGEDVGDDDNDGIPNYLDDDAGGTTPNAIQLGAGGGTMVSSSGKLELGETAFAQGADGVLVSMDDIVSGGGISDGGADPSCIGGCFDFAVTDLPPGDSVQVILPLTDVIPEGAVYRKLIAGAWRDFSATGGNAIASAASVAGVCPAAGAADYVDDNGLVAGHDCVRLTLADGGPNDADGLPNGIVRDPGGVAIAAAVETPISTIGDPNLGGGCAISTERQAHQRLDLWLLAGLLSWLGLRRRQAS